MILKSLLSTGVQSWLWVLRLMSWTFRCCNSKGMHSTLNNPWPYLLFQVHTISKWSKYFAKFYIICQSSSLFLLLKRQCHGRLFPLCFSCMNGIISCFSRQTVINITLQGDAEGRVFVNWCWDLSSLCPVIAVCFFLPKILTEDYWCWKCVTEWEKKYSVYKERILLWVFFSIIANRVILPQ